jgi:simple sugar transport system permease protein/ribose transport system permease protein
MSAEKTIMERMERRRRANINLVGLASRYGTVVAAVVIFIAFATLSDKFMSFNNVSNVLVQISVLMITSSGLTIAVASGEFDLSVGEVASLSSMLVAGLIVWNGRSLPVAILLPVLAGAAIGAINGLLVARLRIPSMIATLAMGPIALGLNYAYDGGDSIYAPMPDNFYYIATGRLFSVVPVPIVIALTIVMIFYVLLNWTRLGRTIVATGSNIQAARLSGIAVNRARQIALTCSGVGAALGGVLLTARLGTGQPGAGEPYLMDSLTAVFLGMTTFKPGRATVQGTLVGVFIIGMLDNGLSLMGAPFYAQNIVRGIVMIAAVSFAVLRGEMRLF